MTKYYVDIDGNYLGGFDGVRPPSGSLEVPNPPEDGRSKWVDGSWGDPVLSNEEQIAELEGSITNRNLRGAALGDQYAIDHIQSVEDQISALRG